MIPKFRAWSKTEKKMLNNIQEINFEFNGELVGVESESLDYHGANEIVVMQYTGLLDLVITEIYQYDIVKVYNYGAKDPKDFVKVGIVVFWNGSWRFFYVEEGIVNHVFLYDLNPIEVIGNYFENKDLVDYYKLEELGKYVAIK